MVDVQIITRRQQQADQRNSADGRQQRAGVAVQLLSPGGFDQVQGQEDGNQS